MTLKTIGFLLLLSSPATRAQERLLPFSDGKLFGLTNEKSELVLAPAFKGIGDVYPGGYMEIKENGLSGIANIRGQVLAPPKFMFVKVKEPGLAVLMEKGAVIFQPLNKPYSDSGRLRLSDWTDFGFSPAPRLLLVCSTGNRLRGGKIRIYNALQNKLMPGMEFDGAEYLEGNTGRDTGIVLAIVTQKGKKGLLNMNTGKYVLPIGYKYISYGYRQTTNEYLYFATDDEYCYYFKRNRQELKPLPGKNPATDPDILDFSGPPSAEPAELRFPRFELQSNSQNKNAPVQIKDNNNPGKLIPLNTPKDAAPVTIINNAAQIEKVLIKVINATGRFGVINYLGDWVLPMEYDKIEYDEFLDFERIDLFKNRLRGFLSPRSGKLILPCLATRLVYSYRNGAFQPGEQVVTLQNGLSFVINTQTDEIYLPAAYRALIQQ